MGFYIILKLSIFILTFLSAIPIDGRSIRASRDVSGSHNADSPGDSGATTETECTSETPDEDSAINPTEPTSDQLEIGQRSEFTESQINQPTEIDDDDEAENNESTEPELDDEVEMSDLAPSLRTTQLKRSQIGKTTEASVAPLKTSPPKPRNATRFNQIGKTPGDQEGLVNLQNKTNVKELDTTEPQAGVIDSPGRVQATPSGSLLKTQTTPRSPTTSSQPGPTKATRVSQSRRNDTQSVRTTQASKTQPGASTEATTSGAQSTGTTKRPSERPRTFPTRAQSGTRTSTPKSSTDKTQSGRQDGTTETQVVQPGVETSQPTMEGVVTTSRPRSTTPGTTQSEFVDPTPSTTQSTQVKEPKIDQSGLNNVTRRPESSTQMPTTTKSPTSTPQTDQAEPSTESQDAQSEGLDESGQADEGDEPQATELESPTEPPKESDESGAKQSDSLPETQSEQPESSEEPQLTESPAQDVVQTDESESPGDTQMTMDNESTTSLIETSTKRPCPCKNRNATTIEPDIEADVTEPQSPVDSEEGQLGLEDESDSNKIKQSPTGPLESASAGPQLDQSESTLGSQDEGSQSNNATSGPQSNQILPNVNPSNPPTRSKGKPQKSRDSNIIDDIIEAVIDAKYAFIDYLDSLFFD